MEKMLFVYNPNSGKAQISEYLSKILQIFTERYEVVIYPTKAQGDAYRLVKDNAERFDMVACSGGDGTLNEVVAGVMECSNKPLIGYIPSGSTNDYARSVGIPSDMLEAAKNIVEGTPVCCDIGRFNGRYYNYVAAFGAFTEVSYATRQEVKNVLGHQAYLLEGLKSLPYIKPTYMEIEANGQHVEGEFLYGMVTNTLSVGGFKHIAGSDVRLDDGLFEFTFIRKFDDIIDFNRVLTSIINRDFDVPGIYHAKTDHICLKSKVPIPWVLDGEYGGEQKEVVIEIVKNAIRIMAPKELTIQ